MLQDTGVTGHQGRNRKPENLPEREVPRHHGEDDPQWLEVDGAFAVDRVDGEARQKMRRLLGVIPAEERALLDFSDRGADRLSHLEGHELSVLTLPGNENLRSVPHADSARFQFAQSIRAER